MDSLTYTVLQGLNDFSHQPLSHNLCHFWLERELRREEKSEGDEYLQEQWVCLWLTCANKHCRASKCFLPAEMSSSGLQEEREGREVREGRRVGGREGGREEGRKGGREEGGREGGRVLLHPRLTS